MRSERITSLARLLQGKVATFNNTYSAQWLERSLDDSATVGIPLLSDMQCVTQWCKLCAPMG